MADPSERSFKNVPSPPVTSPPKVPNPTKSLTRSTPTQNGAGRGKGRSEQDQGRGQSQELAPPSREETGGRRVNPFVPGGPGDEAAPSSPPPPSGGTKRGRPPPTSGACCPDRRTPPDLRVAPLVKPISLTCLEKDYLGGGGIGIYIIL